MIIYFFLGIFLPLRTKKKLMKKLVGKTKIQTNEMITKKW